MISHKAQAEAVAEIMADNFPADSLAGLTLDDLYNYLVCLDDSRHDVREHEFPAWNREYRAVTREIERRG